MKYQLIIGKKTVEESENLMNIQCELNTHLIMTIANTICKVKGTADSCYINELKEKQSKVEMMTIEEASEELVRHELRFNNKIVDVKINNK